MRYVGSRKKNNRNSPVASGQFLHVGDIYVRCELSSCRHNYKVTVIILFPYLFYKNTKVYKFLKRLLLSWESNIKIDSGYAAYFNTLPLQISPQIFISINSVKFT